MGTVLSDQAVGVGRRGGDGDLARLLRSKGAAPLAIEHNGLSVDQNAEARDRRQAGGSGVHDDLLAGHGRETRRQHHDHRRRHGIDGGPQEHRVGCGQLAVGNRELDRIVADLVGAGRPGELPAAGVQGRPGGQADGRVGQGGVRVRRSADELESDRLANHGAVVGYL